MKLILFLLLTTQLQAGYWKNVELSFYCACKLCTGRYSGLNRTASGTVPTRYRTAASNTLNFGTVVIIPKYGRRVIEDRMSGAYSHRLDIFTDSHARAKKLGVQKIKVWVERKTK
jgi:3D (Asp-Asp-Asp) domain-containing protein